MKSHEVAERLLCIVMLHSSVLVLVYSSMLVIFLGQCMPRIFLRCLLWNVLNVFSMMIAVVKLTFVKRGLVCWRHIIYGYVKAQHCRWVEQNGVRSAAVVGPVRGFRLLCTRWVNKCNAPQLYIHFEHTVDDNNITNSAAQPYRSYSHLHLQYPQCPTSRLCQYHTGIVRLAHAYTLRMISSLQKVNCRTGCVYLHFRCRKLCERVCTSLWANACITHNYTQGIHVEPTVILSLVHTKIRKHDKTGSSHVRFPDGWKAAAERDEIYGWESFKERGLYTENMEGICSHSSYMDRQCRLYHGQSRLYWIYRIV